MSYVRLAAEQTQTHPELDDVYAKLFKASNVRFEPNARSHPLTTHQIVNHPAGLSSLALAFGSLIAASLFLSFPFEGTDILHSYTDVQILHLSRGIQKQHDLRFP